MAGSLTTDQLPAGELQYNTLTGPSTVAASPIEATPVQAAQRLTSADLPKGKLMYNAPSDANTVEVKKVVEQTATDPEIKKPATTLRSYMDSRWDKLGTDISKDYQESVARATRAFQNVADDKITGLEAGLSLAGASFNLFSDIIGETVVNAAGMVGDGVSYIVPDDIEDPIKNGFKASVDFVMNSEVGQQGMEALYSGVEAWDQFAETYPRAAENIRSVVDIGVVLAPVKKGSVGDPISMESKGRTIAKQAGIKQAQNKAINVTDSFSNVKDKDYIARTRSMQPKLTTQERSAIEAVTQLKGYKTGMIGDRTANKNFKLVDKALVQEKSKINKVLSSTDAKISYNNLMNSITKNMDETLSTTLDPKRVKTAIDDVLEATERAIAKHGTSVKGIRKARTDIDTYVQSRLPKNEWSPEHPLVVAANQARRDMNDAVASVVPEFANSMKKQSGLLHAKKGLTSKMALEHRNAITSFVVNATKSVGVTRDVGFVLVGLAGSTYAAAAAPILLAGTGGYAALRLGQGLYKAGINPLQAKKLTGKIIDITGKGIRNASGNPRMVKQLRADRAAMLEIIRDGVDIWRNRNEDLSELEEVSDTLDQTAASEDFFKEQERIKAEANAKLPEGYQPLQVDVNQGQ